MNPTHDTALDALERARRAQEQHDRRIDVQLRLPQGIAAPIRGASDELANLRHELGNLRGDVAGVRGTGIITLEIERALTRLAAAAVHLDRAAQLALALDEQPAATPTMLEADGTDGFRLRDGSQLADHLEGQS